jgi:hypothetical protein
MKEVWAKLWEDFDTQFNRSHFKRGFDRLILHVGSLHNDHEVLRSACERARGSQTFSEWWNRLTKPMKSLIDGIRPLLKSHPADAEVLDFYKHVHVEIATLEIIERDWVPVWILDSNTPVSTVFQLLRDYAGGAARIKGTFVANRLRQRLADDNHVIFFIPPDISELQAAVQACGSLLRQHKSTLGGTGRHLRRAVVDDLVRHLSSDIDDSDQRVTMLLDGAGAGKTVVVRDVLDTVERIPVPVLAIKADLQLSDVKDYPDLQRALRLPQAPEEIVARLAVMGLVVVLIDQIDALSLSLARDQRALNILLELIARLRRIHGVHLLISCRTFDRNSDPLLRRVQTGRDFTIPPLSESEIAEALEPVGIGFKDLLPATRKLLEVPLNLDLFLTAMEGQKPEARLASSRGLTTLQALYQRIWGDIVCRADPGAPPASDREAVLEALTAYMDKHQKTTAPCILLSREKAHLEAGAQWLEREGILIRGEQEWSFMHQTFFDFCYARHFVHGSQTLTQAVLSGSQGVFARSQLRQVLAYLRGTDPPAYIRELDTLLNTKTLRFHLRDLVLRELGQQPEPSDEEWLLAQKMLVDPKLRPEFLKSIAYNANWLSRLFPSRN